MKVLPKPEFKKFVYDTYVEDAGHDKAVLHSEDTYGLNVEGEVVVPSGTSTKIRLHEIGHQIIGNPKLIEDVEGFTPADIAYEEILAEKYAWERMDKPLNYRIGVPAIARLCSEGINSKDAIRLTIRVLRKMGIDVPPQGEKFLYSWHIDEKYL
jgi:hypothetical protein